MPIELVISALAGVLLAMPLIREAFGSAGSPTETGAESLVGETTELLEDDGWVVLRGERWRVRGADALAAGERVRVDSVDGLELMVSPVRADEDERSSRLRYRPSPLWWVSALVGWGASIALALVWGGSVTGAVFACPVVAIALLVSLGGFEFA